MQSAQVIPAVPTQPWRWSLPLAKVFANGPAAVVAYAGLGLEVVFAWQRSGHALWSGGWGTVQAIAFMTWVWLTASWCAYFLARAAQRLPTSQKAIALLFATTAAVAYIASWAIFLQTGRFANWEAVRFTLANLDMLVDFFRAADAMQFVWLALVIGSFMVGLPLLARQLNQPNPEAVNPQRLRLRLCIWLALLMSMSLTQGRVNADLSQTRVIVRTDQFRHCLNPLLTLVCGAVDAWHQEPIPACLDPAELVPLSSANVPVRHSMGKQRSVIIVAIESLRADVIHLRHQGREVTPNINRLAREGLQFTRAYAQSTHSDYADVCLASSLYPLRSRHHHYYRADDPWPKTMLYDLLKPRGYDTAIISSQNEAWGSMDQFLQTPGLDLFYHPQNSSAPTITTDRDPGFNREVQAGALVAGKFPDRHTTDVALDWIKTRHGKPFFLAMNTQSSHFPYLIPDDCPRPFQPCELDSDVKFSSYPAEKAPIVRNAYYNGLAESDRQIGRLVDKLGELGLLDDVILVITGENGEAFHENGEIGHAGNPVEPVIHVAAIAFAPGLIEPRVESYPFEHVDLAPTLCGLLGIESSANFQGIDVLAADRHPAEKRLLFVHVLSPIAQSDAVLRGGRWKYVVTLDRPQGALFDVVADPGEQHDLAASEPARPPNWRRCYTAGGSASWRTITTRSTTVATIRPCRRVDFCRECPSAAFRAPPKRIVYPSARNGTEAHSLQQETCRAKPRGCNPSALVQSRAWPTLPTRRSPFPSWSPASPASRVITRSSTSSRVTPARSSAFDRRITGDYAAPASSPATRKIAPPSPRCLTAGSFAAFSIRRQLCPAGLRTRPPPRLAYQCRGSHQSALDHRRARRAARAHCRLTWSMPAGRGAVTPKHDRTNPVTVYGKTMVAAEWLLADWMPRACILRISLPMGVSFNGHAGAIDWIQSRFKKGRPATLYFDEVRTPTYTDCLNRVFDRAAGQRPGGPLPRRRPAAIVALPDRSNHQPHRRLRSETAHGLPARSRQAPSRPAPAMSRSIQQPWRRRWARIRSTLGRLTKRKFLLTLTGTTSATASAAAASSWPACSTAIRDFLIE